MLNNSSGKVLTVIVIIVAILLVTLTACSMFYWQKEIENHRMTQLQLDNSLEQKKSLDEELGKLGDEVKEIKKQNFLFQEKNKEADERINSLLDELELEEGLKEEMRLEIASLKEGLDTEQKEKDQLRDQLTKDLKDAEEKVDTLETQLKGQGEKISELEAVNKELQNKVLTLQDSASIPGTSSISKIMDDIIAPSSVELDSIIVTQNTDIETVDTGKAINSVPQGRILSVDNDTEFVIVDLGQKNGIKRGRIFSVFRGKEYLGDIKVTRVQTEMSAADLIPPFTSKLVRKNDQVIAKD